MFQKIFSKPLCLFPEANTTPKRIVCGVVGLGAAAATVYGIWQGVVVGKHLIETKPLSLPKELSLVERKNRQLTSLIWQTPLAVTFSAGFSGSMLYRFGEDSVVWFKNVRGSQVCCDIVRSTMGYSLRAPIYGILFCCGFIPLKMMQIEFERYRYLKSKTEN